MEPGGPAFLLWFWGQVDGPRFARVSTELEELQGAFIPKCEKCGLVYDLRG